LGRRLQYGEIVQAVGEADAVIAGVEPYDAAILDALPRVRCISRCGIGTDAIDLGAAKRKGIAVFTTQEEVVQPVAELTLGFILNLARNIDLYTTELRTGVWRRHEAHLLSEWNIGLVGFGRTGQAVAKHLRVFGSRILVADPAALPGELPAYVELCRLEFLLAQSDLVSLHVSRRPEDGPIMDARAFSLMKPGSCFINTSRGYLVDENALLQALQSKHVAAAALDVFKEEPYSGPLTKLPQVLATPHVATLTRASRRAMELRCAQNIIGFLGNTNHSGTRNGGPAA
jgi:D-3-phosphoglycerate dehydrogenase